MQPNIVNLLRQAVNCGIASSVSLAINEKFINIHNNNAIYDLASLTKIIGTTLAITRAIIDKRMSMSEEPIKSWPGISIGHMLAHSSGMPAHIKFYEDKNISSYNFIKNQDIIYNNLFKQKPIMSPGKLRVYSDLNFLTLGWLLEKRYNKPLGEIFKNTWDNFEIGQNLRFFYSQENNLSLNLEIAPAGFCPVRSLFLRGQVHDLNCYYLGGLAGHAGIFGSLSSVQAFGEFFLRCVKSPSNAYEKLVAFCALNSLGFARRENRGSVRALSPLSFGHFGFTGTSLWIDFHANIFLALLTNRVHKNTRPEGIFWLRQRVHDMALRA